MIERGFWEAIDFYPSALLPILTLAVAYQWWRFMQQVHKSGRIAYNSQAGQWFYLFFNLFANISVPALLIYGVIIFGWIFLLAIPAAAVLSFPLTLLGIVPFSHYVFPLAYMALIVCCSVLFGFFDIGLAAAFNEWFFSLFAGVS